MPRIGLPPLRLKGDGAIPLEELFNVVASYVALVVEVGAVVVVIIGGTQALWGARPSLLPGKISGSWP
jgi:hypothetical protein